MPFALFSILLLPHTHVRLSDLYFDYNKINIIQILRRMPALKWCESLRLLYRHTHTHTRAWIKSILTEFILLHNNRFTMTMTTTQSKKKQRKSLLLHVLLFYCCDTVLIVITMLRVYCCRYFGAPLLLRIYTNAIGSIESVRVWRPEKEKEWDRSHRLIFNIEQKA